MFPQRRSLTSVARCLQGAGRGRSVHHPPAEIIVADDPVRRFCRHLTTFACSRHLKAFGKNGDRHLEDSEPVPIFSERPHLPAVAIAQRRETAKTFTRAESLSIVRTAPGYSGGWEFEPVAQKSERTVMITNTNATDPWDCVPAQMETSEAECRRVLIVAAPPETDRLSELFLDISLLDWETREAGTPEQARFMLQHDRCDVVLLDETLSCQEDQDEISCLAGQCRRPVLLLAESDAGHDRLRPRTKEFCNCCPANWSWTNRRCWLWP